MEKNLSKQRRINEKHTLDITNQPTNATFIAMIFCLVKKVKKKNSSLMGGKVSKKGVIKEVSCQSWDIDISSRTEQASLERSTGEFRAHNLVFPEELITLIALRLARVDLNSLGAVAQVCKTWRRISYKDCVWRAIAFDRSLSIEQNDASNIRQRVVSVVLCAKKDFMMIPTALEPLDAESVVSLLKARKKAGLRPLIIAMVGLFPETRGVSAGGSSLVTTFFSRCCSFPLDVLSLFEVVESYTSSALTAATIVDSDGVVVCDGFVQRESPRVLEQLVRDIDRPVVVVRSASELPAAEGDTLEQLLDVCKRNRFPLISSSARDVINCDKVFLCILKMLCLQQGIN